MRALNTWILVVALGAMVQPALAQEGAFEGDVYAGSEEPPVEGEVDISYFFDRLAPYGEWIWTPEYGWVWQPREVWEDWRPYSYGRWVYTNHGWTWSSHFGWGWAPFHYGSWAHMDYLGWIWVPGTVWAPAWVMWRHSDVHIGWAPILAGYGYRYGWAYYPVYYHHWSFIHWDHFCDPHPHHHYIPRGRVYDAFRHTYFPRRCRSRSGEGCVRGPKRDFVAERIRSPVKKRKIQNVEIKARPRTARKTLGVDGDVVKVHKPAFRKGPQRMELSSKPRGKTKSRDLGIIPNSAKPGVARPDRRERLPDSPQVRTQPPGLDRRPNPGKSIYPRQPKVKAPGFSRPKINHSGPRIKTGKGVPIRTPGYKSVSPSKSKPSSSGKVKVDNSRSKMKHTPKMRSRPSRSTPRRSSSGSSSRSSRRSRRK
jgi:hypothetical protein